MPINLPTINPKMMPNELDVVRLPIILPGSMIAVLTNANIGTIKNATGLWSACCKWYETFSLSSS